MHRDEAKCHLIVVSPGRSLLLSLLPPKMSTCPQVPLSVCLPLAPLENLTEQELELLHSPCLALPDYDHMEFS